MFCVKEWTTSDKKFEIWNEYLFKGPTVSWNMEFWFYWMAYFMEKEMVGVVGQFEKKRTNDVRYLDQLQQMKQYFLEILSKCRAILMKHNFFSGFYDFPCGCYSDRYRCYTKYHKTEKIYDNCRMCGNAKDAIMEDVYEMIRGFLVLWLPEFYYVWKLYESNRIRFPIYIPEYDMNILPFDDIGLWEVVCEDDEKQILSHPLLPHPMDFLEKREIVGDLYVDKAQFQYQIPNTLSSCIVVFSKKTPSLIPKVIRDNRQEEKVVIEYKQPKPSQPLYMESTIHNHKQGKPSVKRKLSKILKEGRKKKKSKLIRQRHQENQRCHLFPINDDYDENDSYCDNSYCDDWYE